MLKNDEKPITREAPEYQERYIKNLCTNAILQYGILFSKKIVDVVIAKPYTKEEASEAIKRGLKIYEKLTQQKKDKTFERRMKNLLEDLAFISGGHLAIQYRNGELRKV